MCDETFSIDPHHYDKYVLVATHLPNGQSTLEVASDFIDGLDRARHPVDEYPLQYARMGIAFVGHIQDIQAGKTPQFTTNDPMCFPCMDYVCPRSQFPKDQLEDAGVNFDAIFRRGRG